MITEQQRCILLVLAWLGPISAKGLRWSFKGLGDYALGRIDVSVIRKRLGRLVKRGLVFCEYLDISWEYSNRLAYELTRDGKRVLRDN